MEKEKEGSFVNEDLDNAFVEGELNKTVTANSNENSNWNLLDDPQMETIKKQEIQEDQYDCNFLGVSDKEAKSSSKNMGPMESSIHFKNKGLMASTLPQAKKNEDDDDEDEDLKDMLSQVFKKSQK